MKPLFTKFKVNLPIINFAIAFSALNFQVFVLYPWHNQLNLEVIDLRKVIQKYHK
jgi:hypothetical protein